VVVVVVVEVELPPVDVPLLVLGLDEVEGDVSVLGLVLGLASGTEPGDVLGLVEGDVVSGDVLGLCAKPGRLNRTVALATPRRPAMFLTKFFLCVLIGISSLLS